jgi:hypothetical protein
MTIAKQWAKQWARKLQLGFLALAGALILTACASPQPADYAQEKPVLDLKEYFNGTIDAFWQSCQAFHRGHEMHLGWQYWRTG